MTETTTHKPTLKQVEDAVAATMKKVRAIEAEMGVRPEALARMRDALLELAARKDLFTEAAFAPIETKDAANILYRLSEDADGRFALYLSSDNPGRDRATPPHNHKTWAVIVGLQGEELNRLYERADDGSEPGRGSVKATGEVLLKDGTGLYLMPDDIHSVHIQGGQSTLTMHMYGISIPSQTERIEFYPDGRTGQRKPNPNIRPIPL